MVPRGCRTRVRVITAKPLGNKSFYERDLPLRSGSRAPVGDAVHPFFRPSGPCTCRGFEALPCRNRTGSSALRSSHGPANLIRILSIVHWGKRARYRNFKTLFHCEEFPVSARTASPLTCEKQRVFRTAFSDQIRDDWSHPRQVGQRTSSPLLSGALQPAPTSRLLHWVHDRPGAREASTPAESRSTAMIQTFFIANDESRFDRWNGHKH